MKRIRIGNDIRVQTSLHDLNDFDITSIKQLRCYFIPQCDSYTTPNDTYDPMQYNICNCGKPKYNVFPCNIDAPHWFCGYNGFGVNSKRFIHVDNKFLAPSRLLAEQNRIEAYFPAKAQYQIGEYKFVIVLTIYQPGWCEYNLRTITLDEGVIFALTSDDRDPDHDSIIDLDTTYSINYTIATDLSVEGDNKIYTTHSEMQLDKQFGSFTVFDKRSTKNLDDIIVTSDGCVIKEIHRGIESIEYGINGPITANDGEIKISCTLKEIPKPASKEYTIQYNYDNTQYTVTGPSKITVLNSDLQTDKLVGNFNIVCLGENNINNTQVTSTGCVIETVGAQQSPKLIKGGLYCPITATGDVITINISAGRMYRINYNYDSNYVTVNGNDSAYVDDTTKTGDALPVATFTVIPTNDEYTMTSLDMEITGASLINKPDPNTYVTKAEVTIATPVTLDEITVTITASQFRP